MTDLETITLLALNEIKNFGTKTIINIYENFQYVNENKFDLDKFEDFLVSQKYDYSIIEQLEKNVDFVQYKLSNNDLYDMTIISYFNSLYPMQLKLLRNPPLFLFCRGNINLLSNRKNIAVVGTRENSPIGAKVAQKTSEYFASNNYTIVSGLAKGIDTAGHLGALNAQGHTIAILTDLIKIYPKENLPLIEKILSNNGLIFSEIAPWKNVYRSAFVERDRLQSGMSLATFVIETDIKGGTMHTVNFTIEQNRHLFVPDFTRLPYQDNFAKINGIKFLLNESKAKAYSNINYDEILNLLEEKEKEILTEYSLKINNIRTLL